MMVTIDDLKQIAGKISEGYLFRNEDMTSSIVELARQARLNEEMVKRICELANQNTYLTLFNNQKANRGNIQFDVADFEKVLSKLKEYDMANEDYLKTPEDYRLSDSESEAVPKDIEELEGIEDEEEGLSEGDIINILIDLNARRRLKDKLEALLSFLKSIEKSEEMDLEENLGKISSYSKSLVFNGESFGDMAKLAMRFTHERGYDLSKTSHLLVSIYNDLKNKGFRVNESLTKISSMKINPDHELYRMFDEMHLHLMKISALKQMQTGVQNVLTAIRKALERKPKASV